MEAESRESKGTRTSNVVEVTDATFVRDVVEESKRRPVVVDFWAEWCKPCRMIGPVLERLADQRDGEFLLAKLDVDANPQASSTFQIQSIPAVKAFRDGRIVDEFIGVIPEHSIQEFLDGVVPSEADRLAAQAFELERTGHDADAEGLYRRAFHLDPRNVPAALGLGRLTAERGDLDEARRLLEPLRPNPEAERVLAAIEVSNWSGAASSGSAGPLTAAERDAAEGRFGPALEAMLEIVRAGGEERDAAREAMVKVFAVVGDGDPLTLEYRRKLAAALF
jgi:putative thioredoxin